MVEDLLIINDSDLLLFGWHPEGVSGVDQDNLISDFFTALNSFATFEKGEDLKAIMLRETRIIFKTTKNEVIFISYKYPLDQFETYLRLEYKIKHQTDNQENYSYFFL